jgi:hypothetical protein
MPPDTLEILRRVNGNLRSAIVRLRPERRHCSTLQPKDLSDLIGEVLQATECLRNVHVHSADSTDLEDELVEKEAIEKEAFANETLEYRRHLEDLKQFLPDLHVRLLAERARLESARAHLSAASAWAGARKETL